METENNVTSLRVASFSCYLDTADNNFLHKIKKALEDPIPDTISSQEISSYPIVSGRSKSAIIKPSINNHISHSPRVASFSHFPDTAEENFAFKVSGTLHDPAAALVLPQKVSGVTSLKKPKSKDGEIDIFGAEKYFNMKLDCETETKQGYYTDRPVDLPQKKLNSRPGTPSGYSEASSWNSQTTLLRNLHRNANQVKQKKALVRRIFTSFACSGPCLDKKAVHINSGVENGVEYGTKSSQEGSRMDDHFATQILNSKTENLRGKRQLLEEKIEDPHQSLELFGCNEVKKGDIVTANLERKVSMLTWDAIPKAQSLATTTRNSSTICDDMASDASSDLFELEHISGNGYGLLTTREPDTISGCISPTTQYAPSEAINEWSVVTASAADFSSVTSDYEERSISMAGADIARDAPNKTAKTNNAVGKEAPKSHPGGFLGCKSQKAVSVAETVCKTPEKAKHQGMI